MVESYEYSAYGEVLDVKDASGNSIENRQSSIGNRYTFQGREIDWSTGLIYFRARWYDPDSGRWISKDPIGISGGLNLYEFCGNNPVNRIDPDGKFWLQAIGAAIGATANAIVNYDAFSSGEMSGLEYAGSILLGAGLGALSPSSLTGTLLTGAANNLYNQMATNEDCEEIDLGEVGLSSAGGLAGAGVASTLGAAGNQVIRPFIPQLGAPATYAAEGAIAGAVSAQF